MKKRPFILAKGVSNIELFYDLIFVYCISVMTSLCHHVHGGFLDLETWVVFMFSYLVVLQVWIDTTILINRYGDRSASDNVCLFINMFLLYYLANGIQVNWENSIFTFVSAWALILANLIVHWVTKLLRYENLDDDDRKIMRWNIVTLAVQLVAVVIVALLSAEGGSLAAWIALLIGAVAWRQPKVYTAKPSRFSHIAERCSLLVIVAFGETIVAISSYMTTDASMLYPILVFALVVGLFLIFIYEHDNMIDHHRKTDGILFLSLTGWVIVVVGNLTVALEYMPMEEVAFIPKSAMLTACIVIYLLTSFLLVRFNKPEFHYSGSYIIGRVGACVVIVVVAIATHFDLTINLVCDVLAVYFALWHEWILYHGRMSLLAFGRSLGMSDDDLSEAANALETFEGRRAVVKAARKAREAQQEEEAAQDSNGDERG